MEPNIPIVRIASFADLKLTQQEELKNTNVSLTNDFIYIGLEDALKHHINLSNTQDENVITDIYFKGETMNADEDIIVSSIANCLTIYQSEDVCFGDGTKIFDNKKGITVIFEFYGDDNENHDRFKNLEIISLFTAHTSLYDDTLCHEYAIDFGLDSHGAACLISKVLQEVYELPKSEALTILTGVGNQIEENRDIMNQKLEQERGFDLDDSDEENSTNSNNSFDNVIDIFVGLAVCVFIGFLCYFGYKTIFGNNKSSENVTKTETYNNSYYQGQSSSNNNQINTTTQLLNKFAGKYEAKWIDDEIASLWHYQGLILKKDGSGSIIMESKNSLTNENSRLSFDIASTEYRGGTLYLYIPELGQEAKVMVKGSSLYNIEGHELKRKY